MKKQEFINISKNKILYLDGATGTNLIKAGMPAGVCPEVWITEHREVLLQLQRAYVEAGTNILYAPTFSANSIKLAEYGIEERLEELTVQLVAISKEAAGDRAYVAGDITMTGQQLKPIGTMELETLISIYQEQIRCLVKAGVDLLVIETMMSLAETRAAVIAAKEVCDLPVMVTMTFEEDGRTLYGTDAVTAAVVLEKLGVSAIGANCSTGPDKMINIIRQMAEHVDIPIIAKPNAGLPYINEAGETCYSMDAKEFAVKMQGLIEAGASILGGCCGTCPEYIQALKQDTEACAAQEGQMQRKAVCTRDYRGLRYLTSERQTAAFHLEGNFMLIGERINPTGKKKLQAELKEGRFDMVRSFAEEQELCGASILDVNMGMSGIDEKAMMLKAIEEITEVTSLPLSLDSSNVEVMEAALRHYPGRALVNSVSYEQEKFEKLLPLVKKYGAMFILLPLSDKGLPENLQEKKEIIQKIYERATELGIAKEDIIVDGLVTTVGANKKAALETLETIRYCKDRGLATICGLSNISFGLPERSFVNTAFLTLAIGAGLTMAIANPSQELLTGCALATDMLLCRNSAEIRYIEYAGIIKEKRQLEEAAGDKKTSITMAEMAAKKLQQGKSSSQGTVTDIVNDRTRLSEAVLKGNRNSVQAFTKQALDAGEPARELLDAVLLPAINQVGDLFDKGKYFLPQLIASAEAMKLAIEVLEPYLTEEQTEANMPVVVIATVAGDIHDIGKNLVALMLKNYGFTVIDLGKDVSREVIIEAAKEHHAQIIALSALMTTTMQQMKQVVSYAKEQGVDAKIIIGGAVTTQEYADEIGADGYSKDAAEAVRTVRRLLGMLNQ